jgi:hypothetical protein
MNGTTNIQARSVQIAVMAAPSVTLAEAVAQARRRHDTSGAWTSIATTALRTQPAAG